MKNFFDIGTPADRVLDRLNIVNPTEIQELSIPSALRGAIFGIAKLEQENTFVCITIVMSLKANANKRALILSPTRELATQIMKSILSYWMSATNQKLFYYWRRAQTRQEKALRNSLR